MAPKRRWTIEQLRLAVEQSTSIRQVLLRLGLRAAGGNYAQLKRVTRELQISTSHFLGMASNRGKRFPMRGLDQVLRADTFVGSFRLKKRLFAAGLKQRACEECGWAQQTADGYLPLELDHINGDRNDNRLENLRVLCPNCHSLKPTHRGRKLRGRLRGSGGT